MMIEDEKLDNDEMLLSSPRIIINNEDQEMEDQDILNQSIKSIKQNTDEGPNWDHFQIQSILGEGAFGKVFKVYKKEGKKLAQNKNLNTTQNKGDESSKSNQSVQNKSISFSKGMKLLSSHEGKRKGYVIKELFTDQMPKEYALQAMEEIQMLGSLSSPYIVSYIDSFISDTKVNIIMEYCDHGDLESYLLNKAKNSKKGLPENSIWRIFIQICLGVHYLHNKDILHRDLKALNIFLCKDNIVKIGDLGVARKVSEAQFATPMERNKYKHNGINQTSQVGTPFYLAPEIWDGKPYTQKSDMWSLGVILYELCTLNKPFLATSIEELKNKVLKEKPNAIPINKVSKDLTDLINKLLRKNPQHRPTINEIIDFQCFKSKAKLLKIKLPIHHVEKQEENKLNNTKSNNYMTASKILSPHKTQQRNQKLSLKGVQSQNNSYSSSQNKNSSSKKNQSTLSNTSNSSKNKSVLMKAGKGNLTSRTQKNNTQLNIRQSQNNSINSISQASFNSNNSTRSNIKSNAFKSVGKVTNLKEKQQQRNKNSKVNQSYQCNTIKELINKEDQENHAQGKRTNRERIYSTQNPNVLKSQKKQGSAQATVPLQKLQKTRSTKVLDSKCHLKIQMNQNTLRNELSKKITNYESKGNSLNRNQPQFKSKNVLSKVTQSLDFSKLKSNNISKEGTMKNTQTKKLIKNKSNVDLKPTKPKISSRGQYSTNPATVNTQKTNKKTLLFKLPAQTKQTNQTFDNGNKTTTNQTNSLKQQKEQNILKNRQENEQTNFENAMLFDEEENSYNKGLINEISKDSMSNSKEKRKQNLQLTLTTDEGKNPFELEGLLDDNEKDRFDNDDGHFSIKDEIFDVQALKQEAIEVDNRDKQRRSLIDQNQ